MSKTSRLALDASVLVAYLLANNPSATGIAIHEWLSIGLALVLCVHVALNWEWISNAIARMFARAKAVSKLNLAVDIVLFVAFVVVMLSGVLISKVVLGVLGIHMAAGGVWRIAHTLSADIALGALAIHFALHWGWIVDTSRRLFARKSLVPVAVKGGDYR
jgi:hypothetical protein